MKNSQISNSILTIKEVAEYLKISIAQVYRFIDRTENPLPVIYISDKTKRVRMEDLQQWMNTQKEDAFSNEKPTSNIIDGSGGKGGE